jgi:hypothetical protein
VIINPEHNSSNDIIYVETIQTVLVFELVIGHWSYGTTQKALQERYSIAFPEDFFQFWEFACHLNPENPLEALIEPLDINLVGPFELLGGRFDGKEPKLSFDLHWRYYRDPPEFFTVLQGHVDGLHWGYYFDDPNSLPSCVSHYYQNDAYALSQMELLYLMQYRTLWRWYMKIYCKTSNMV